jgi:hypothetical protein
MVKVDRSHLLLIFLVLLPGAYVIAVFLADGSAAARSTVQLVVFPLLLFLLSRLRLFGGRIPSALLLGACLLGLSGAVFNHQGAVFEPGAFLLTRFDGDRLGGETKIARDKIRTALGDDIRLSVSDTERVVRSQEEARAILDARSSLAGIVWGSNRWATVTLRESPPVSLQTLAVGSVGAAYLEKYQLQDLLVVTSVPSVGVSFVSQPQSIEFLGRLIASWRGFAQAIVSTSDTSELQRQLLLQATSLVAWTSPEPQVFSQWLLGTYYVGQGLAGSVREPALLACAKETLQHGYRKLRRNEAPVLEAAIINNYVVAQLIGRDGVMPFGEAAVDAIQQLKTAYQLVVNPRLQGEVSNQVALAAVLQNNIRYLKSSYGKQKRSSKFR